MIEGHDLCTDISVISCGAHSGVLCPELKADINASRGQIDVFDRPAVPHILTEGGYVAPISGGVIAGATYTKLSAPEEVMADAASTHSNRLMAEQLIGEEMGARTMSRASLRATTPDRHPIYGPAPESEYGEQVVILSGLGSRGLSTGPFLAHAAIAEALALPSPLTVPMAAMVNPARFAERRRRKGKQ